MKLGCNWTAILPSLPCPGSLASFPLRGQRWASNQLVTGRWFRGHRLVLSPQRLYEAKRSESAVPAYDVLLAVHSRLRDARKLLVVARAGHIRPRPRRSARCRTAVHRADARGIDGVAPRRRRLAI